MKCETPDKCRITPAGPSLQTLAYYPPIYDGHGNNLNPDRNTTITTMRCKTCGKEWNEITGGIKSDSEFPSITYSWKQ